MQDDGIPLWVAGAGEKKTLRIVAKYASYANFGGNPEEFQRKSQILAEHCRDVGADFGAITRSSNFNVVTAETEKDVADKLAWVKAHYQPLVSGEALAGVVRDFGEGQLVGTPEQIVERLAALEKLGMTYAIGYFIDAAYDPSSRELFADQVIPALRD